MPKMKLVAGKVDGNRDGTKLQGSDLEVNS